MRPSRLRRQQIGLAQAVYRLQSISGVHLPEGPAVAAGRILEFRAQAVDRTAFRVALQRSVRAHDCPPATLRVGQHRAG